MSPPTCRLCGTVLERTFVDLGLSPIANEYPTLPASPDERRYPLHAMVCDACLLVQVAHDVPPDVLFGDDYAYFSSFSDSWVEHARRFQLAMVGRLGLGPDSLVTEVASNDGYLLQHFVAAGIPVLGIEPAANCAAEAERRGVRTISEFLDGELGRKVRDEHGPADLVVANNVLAHVPALDEFVAGLAGLLGPDGVLSIEHPHLLNLIDLVQFDTIYHEHYSYLSLLVDERALARHGLRVFDVERLPTHGGSLRVLACHDGASHVEQPGVARVRTLEHDAGLDRVESYDGFAPRVERCCAEVTAFLEGCRERGERVAGYGAAAKGVTFVNRAGIGPDLVPVVADRSPHKQGRYLPGVGIPIVAPDALAELRPDVVLVLAWNLADEVVAQLQPVLPPTTRYVVAVPALRDLP